MRRLRGFGREYQSEGKEREMGTGSGSDLELLLQRPLEELLHDFLLEGCDCETCESIRKLWEATEKEDY